MPVASPARVLRQAAASLVVLLSTACPPTDPGARACRATRECDPGDWCLQGTCTPRGVRACTVDGDCGLDGACLLGVCGGGTACATTSDCGVGEACSVDGVCRVAACSPEGTCPNGGGCDFALDRCGPVRTCTTDSQCQAPDGTCDGGICIPGCGKTSCPEGLDCDAGSGRCVTATPCADDAACDAPDTICRNERCVPGCHRPGSTTCPATRPCNPSSGRCETPRACLSDPDCERPARICVDLVCVPGCGETGGTPCTGTDTCSPVTGRCGAPPPPCSNDAACSPPSTVCEGTQCVPGCTTTGCGSNETCNTFSGRCDPVQAGCSSDAECSPPTTICTGNSCVPGCPSTGCATGTCNGSTGRCGSAVPAGRCYRSSDCALTTDFCLSAGADGAVLGTCTRACGTSSDCLTGERCTEYPGLPGMKACLTSTDLGVSVGVTPAAGFCSRSSDCQSGMCGGSNSCIADCSKDAHCVGGADCRGYTSATGAWVQGCMSDATAQVIIGPVMDFYPSACTLECDSLFCDDLAEKCFEPCCNSRQCAAGDACLTMNPISTVDSARNAGNPTPANTLMRGCGAPAGVTSVGTGAVGSACSFEETNSRCRSGLCISTDFSGNEVTPYCSDTCCTDTDCGVGYRCIGAWDDQNAIAFPVCVRG